METLCDTVTVQFVNYNFHVLSSMDHQQYCKLWFGFTPFTRRLSAAIDRKNGVTFLALKLEILNEKNMKRNI